VFFGIVTRSIREKNWEKRMQDKSEVKHKGERPGGGGGGTKWKQGGTKREMLNQEVGQNAKHVASQKNRKMLALRGLPLTFNDVAIRIAV